MSLSRRVIFLTYSLFGVFGLCMFLVNNHYQRSMTEKEVRYFLGDLYGSLLYRSLRGQMFVGRPDKAREMYQEIREVLKDKKINIKKNNTHGLFDSDKVSMLKIGELLVLRTDGTEAFVDDNTIDFVNNRTGESFPLMMDSRKPRVFKSKGLNRALKTLKPVEEVIETRSGPELRLYNPLPNTQKCQGCHGPDHSIRGIVHLRIPLAPLNDRLRMDALRMAFILFTGASVTSFLLVLFLKRWLIKPLEELESVTQEIIKGNYAVRPALYGSDELARLALQMTQMVEALGLIKTGKSKGINEIIKVEWIIEFCGSLSEEDFDLFEKCKAISWKDNETGFELYFGGQGSLIRAAFAAINLKSNKQSVCFYQKRSEGNFNTLSDRVLINIEESYLNKLIEVGFIIKNEGQLYFLEGITKGSKIDALDPEIFES